MIAIDTNVLVTFLARRQDPDFPAVAARFVNDEIIIIPTVLLETEWVMRSIYRHDARTVIDSFERLGEMPNVLFDPADEIDAALSYAKLGLDFADAVHLALAQKAAVFLTLDRAFARRAARCPGAPAVRAVQDFAS